MFPLSRTNFKVTYYAYIERHQFLFLNSSRETRGYRTNIPSHLHCTEPTVDKNCPKLKHLEYPEA